MNNNSLVVSHENGNTYSVVYDSVPDSIQFAIDTIIQYAAERTLWIDED